jgi:hypothetical protein
MRQVREDRGKILGRCTYAGWPLTKTYHITIVPPSIYLEYTLSMYMTEEIEPAFLIQDGDLKLSKEKFLKADFDAVLETDSETGKILFSIGWNLYIEYDDDQYKATIDEIIVQFKQHVHAFYEESVRICDEHKKRYTLL